MINIFSATEEIQFVSRETILKASSVGHLDNSFYVISINDTPEEAVAMADSLAPTGVHFTTYVFPDNDDGLCGDDIERIITGVRCNLMEGRKILTHCYLGISRSGAVAKFINEYFEMDNLFLESYGNYNRAIYNSMNAYVGLDLAAYYRSLDIVPSPDSNF